MSKAVITETSAFVDAKGWQDEVAGALRRLHLRAVADAVESLGLAADAPWSSGLDALVSVLRDGQASRALQKRFDAARLPMPSACMAQAWTGIMRGLPAEALQQLVGGDWAKRETNVLIQAGCAGGKTWVASALASEVLRAGGTVEWFHQADLFAEWAGAAVESTHALAKLRQRLERATVVVLEELGVEPLQAGDLEVLRRVAECRQGGFILTSPFAPEQWLEHWRGTSATEVERYTAEAIERRLLNASHRFVLRGKAAEYKPGAPPSPPTPLPEQLAPGPAERLPPSKRAAKAASKR